MISRKHMINRAVLLSAMLICIFAFPMSASAASSGGWLKHPGKKTERVAKSVTYQVEAGQTFYLCDYIRIWDPTGMSYAPPTNVKLKYSSSDRTVASVKGSYGKVTTKKAGTAKITATCKKERFTLKLKVKDRGVLRSTGTLNKFNAASKNLAGYFRSSPKKTRNKIRRNFNDVVQLACTYTKQRAKTKVSSLLKKKGVLGAPTFLRSEMVLRELDQYISEANCLLKVSSVHVTAGSDAVKVTLASPVTEQQLAAFQMMQYLTTFSETKKGLVIDEYRAAVDCEKGNSYMFKVTSADGRTVSYKSICKFTVGSREVQVQLYTGRKSVIALNSGDRVSTDIESGKWMNIVTSASVA